MLDWNMEARRVLKVELARKGVGYKKLAILLKGIGVAETQSSIANKLSRGTFSFAFFMQCITALGLTSVNIRMPAKGEIEDIGGIEEGLNPTVP